MQPASDQALAAQLLAMGDDELILAHRNSEWTGHAPILEEDIAFTNIALDELGHARLWYELYSALTGASADDLIFFREAGDYRSLRLVELPRGDWAFTMLRQYLFDAFEVVRAEQLQHSAYQPLAEAAAKVLQEERYHYRHTETWIRRLGLGTAESYLRTQTALNRLWPYAAQLFQVAAPERERLPAAVYPDSGQLRAHWQELVLPFLADAGLQAPPLSRVVREGRDVHTEHLAPLLEELQEVARQDPGAAW